MTARAHARRITLLLGNGETTRTALELLALLDEKPPTELHGLFLEDDDLLRVAALPFVREVCRLTFVERDLQSADLERHLRIQARAARAALEAAAARVGLPFTFRTFRGVAAALLAEISQEMDLLILAPLRRAGHLERHPLLGARVRPRRGPAAVLLGQGESAGRALELASRLCAVTGQELLVMYRDHTGTPPEVLHRALADRLGVAPVAWRTHELAATSALPDACRQLRVATLVLPADDALAGPHALLELRGALECPLLLVR